MSEAKSFGFHKCFCGDPICKIYIMNNQSTGGFEKKDAIIMSVAPLMLELLEELTESLEKHPRVPQQIILTIKAKAVIAIFKGDF